jgi:iron(III) transport system substrate-binding protein
MKTFSALPRRRRAALALLVLLVLAGLAGCGRDPAREVVAYIAQDQVFAEPLLAEFTRQTGIRVRAVFDSEAVKTVGLANRLLAEQARPLADVFWGNEELRTRQLAARGVWREPHGWAAFGHRSRRVVVNTNHIDLPGTALGAASGRLPAPASLFELTNTTWRGRVALAYPLFGTTATHFLALRQYWGAERWEAWCRALAANQPLVVDGNSVVAKLVAKGEAWVGLTDSDDIQAVQREGAPVAALPWNDETLLIPNTVAVVRGAPHPEAADELFAWLQRPEVAARLVAAGALEGVETAPAGAKTLTPDWSRLVSELEAVTDRLKTIFLR